MKVTRHGLRRNKGTDELVRVDLVKSATEKWRQPKWNAETREVTFFATGSDRGSSYRYNITLPLSELITLLGLSGPALLADAPSTAVFDGAFATLQSILASRVQSAK